MATCLGRRTGATNCASLSFNRRPALPSSPATQALGASPTNLLSHRRETQHWRSAASHSMCRRSWLLCCAPSFRISEADEWILRSLLDEARLVRLLEHRVYPLEEFFADLRRGIWAELEGPPRPIDPYRAALQRAYLELMAERLFYSPAIRAYARGE